MKKSSVEFGFFILSIGVVLFLINIGVINWSILEGLFYLWPAIFIVIGINVIFKNNSIVRIITWLLFLAAIVSYGYFFEGNPWNKSSGWRDTVLSEKYSETERGEFKLALGATRINVDSTGSKLVDAKITDTEIKNRIDYSDNKKKVYVEFKRQNYNILSSGGIRDDCKFSINDGMIWDMDIDTGAVNGTIDMSNLKVQNLDIDMGAGNLKLIFGDKYKSTNVKIDAGASSFDVSVPKGSGVRIKMDGALNNTNLRDLNWNRDGKYYISPNYDSAQNKIDMDIDMGVGQFRVNVR